MAPKFTATHINANLEKALDLSIKAETEDKSKQFPEAFRLYKRTLQTYLTVIEDMLFECIKFQERNEDLLRLLSTTDKYKKLSTGIDKRVDDGSDFEPTSVIHRLPGTIVVTPDKPVKWTDIIGHETPKFVLKLAVLDRCPIKHPVMYQGKRKTLKTVLLFGPRGVGKSYLLKAVAGGVRDWTVFLLDCRSIVPCVAPGTEDLHIKTLFKSARLCEWAVICLDNIEALCQPPKNPELEQSHQKIKDAIKTELGDVLEKPWAETIVVVAATNEPHKLDADIVKKFSRKLYLAMPRADDRLKIFRQHIGKAKCTLTDDDYIALADKTINYTGGEISEVVRLSLKEDGSPVSLADLEGSLGKVTPKTTPDDVQVNLKFKEEFCPYE